MHDIKFKNIALAAVFIFTKIVEERENTQRFKFTNETELQAFSCFKIAMAKRLLLLRQKDVERLTGFRITRASEILL